MVDFAKMRKLAQERKAEKPTRIELSEHTPEPSKPRMSKIKEQVSADKSLSIEQHHAIGLCCDLDERIVSVTGGAGVGKTLVLGHVYRELRNAREAVVLAAPTGRAAKRIQELTGIAAKTLHRLLEFPQPDDPDDDGNIAPNEPKRNRHNPLLERVVIVDEASMVSPTIFQQLCDALPARGCIRLFGDNNQLPPIEEGAPPFVTMLEEKPSVELTFNFRSDDAIVSNALRILEGRMPLRNDRFEIMFMNDPVLALTKYTSKEFCGADFQVIMPTRRGKFGTQRVNPSIQLKYNGKGGMLRLDRFDEKEAPLVIRPKDKFVWIKNDYKLEMFNGEIGRVDWIDDEDGSLGLSMPDGNLTRTVEVPPQVRVYSSYHGHVIDYDPRKQIELGYAITTHKSQGSEFHTVIYCMTGHAAFLLNRQNFYTAITRAKHRVILVCDRKGMGLSLRKLRRD